MSSALDLKKVCQIVPPHWIRYPGSWLRIAERKVGVKEEDLGRADERQPNEGDALRPVRTAGAILHHGFHLFRQLTFTEYQRINHENNAIE